MITPHILLPANSTIKMSSNLCDYLDAAIPLKMPLVQAIARYGLTRIHTPPPVRFYVTRDQDGILSITVGIHASQIYDCEAMCWPIYIIAGGHIPSIQSNVAGLRFIDL